MALTNSLKENKNANCEVVVKCPHCGQRLMDAEYVVARIKCPRCKNYVALRVENKELTAKV
jgi:phage FluMu protein Com